MSDKIEKTDEQWKQELDAETYHVTREKGTERPHSGKYNECEAPGTYACKCCGQVLFESGAKFNAGCGWPSFHTAAEADHIDEHEDTSHGMVRTEVTCSRCGAHLGHVFPDGPPPTGLRYCINSVSIDLKPSDGA